MCSSKFLKKYTILFVVLLDMVLADFFYSDIIYTTILQDLKLTYLMQIGHSRNFCCM